MNFQIRFKHLIFIFIVNAFLFTCAKNDENTIKINRLNELLYSKIDFDANAYPEDAEAVAKKAGETLDFKKKAKLAEIAGIKFFNKNNFRDAYIQQQTSRNIIRRTSSDEELIGRAQHLLAKIYLRASSDRKSISTYNLKKSLKESNELLDEVVLDQSIQVYKEILEKDAADENAKLLLEYAKLNKGQF